MKSYIDVDKENIDFLIESFWGLHRRQKKLEERLTAQGKTISDLQVKISNQADMISELQSKLYHGK